MTFWNKAAVPEEVRAVTQEDMHIMLFAQSHKMNNTKKE